MKEREFPDGVGPDGMSAGFVTSRVFSGVPGREISRGKITDADISDSGFQSGREIVPLEL
jgi:hypothetical protein